MLICDALFYFACLMVIPCDNFTAVHGTVLLLNSLCYSIWISASVIVYFFQELLLPLYFVASHLNVKYSSFSITCLS
jgi:hypothetical protein